MAEVLQDTAPTVDHAAKGRELTAEQLRSVAARYRDEITAIETEVIAMLDGRPSSERMLDRIGGGLAGPHEVFRLRVAQALEVVCDR